MLTSPIRASRMLWLSIAVLAAPVLLAAQPSAAQSGVACGAACTFLPVVNSHGAVFVERVTVACDESADPIPCWDVVGYIRNESAAPVYNVQLDSRVLLPNGRQDVLTSPMIALRGLAPGQSTPFSIRSDGFDPWPATSTAAIVVRTYDTAPGTYRPITVVDSRVVVKPPDLPDFTVLRIVLRNDSADYVGNIQLVLAMGTPEFPHWRNEPIPELAPGERFVFDYVLHRPNPYVSGVYGAEGVMIR